MPDEITGHAHWFVVYELKLLAGNNQFLTVRNAAVVGNNHVVHTRR